MARSFLVNEYVRLILIWNTAGSLNDSALGNRKGIWWWAARREFTVWDRLPSEHDTEAPDVGHTTIGRDVTLSTAALNIETATMPCAMVMAVVTVLCLPLRTVRRCPLRRRIPLCDRQRSGQPEHGAAAGQCPSNVLSCLRQHGRCDPTTLPAFYEDPPNNWNDLVIPKM